MLEAASPQAPPPGRILEDLEALHAALGERMAAERSSGAA